MEAKELMIGDVVLWGGEASEVTYIDFLGGVGVENKKTYGFVADTELKPIPLTKEIMEANGWEAEPEYDEAFGYIHYRWTRPDGICPELLQLMDGSNLWIVFDNTKVMIHNIHELQHALRLCGLNDLADNFKIE